MKLYLVGGSVRDYVMGRKPRDMDYLATETTATELKKQRYKPVGKNHTVFIMPEYRHEVSLAQDKEGNPITLEEELNRQDFTMNALAMEQDGTLIDLFDGKKDIENRIIRHVGQRFSEDPLRVLRGARFAAQFPDFTIAPETMILFSELDLMGALSDLHPNRVWEETKKALHTPAPQRYFEVLHECRALARVFPEIDCLFGIPQPEEHHPEIDTGLHTMMVLKQAAKRSDSLAVRFGALVHDLGKGVTGQDKLPQHIGHEKRGVEVIDRFSKRFNVQKYLREFGKWVSRWHLHVHRAKEVRPNTLLKMFDAIRAFQEPVHLKWLLLVCEADARGRKGREESFYDESELVWRAFEAAQSVSAKELLDQGVGQDSVPQRLQQERILAIKAVMR